VFRRLNQDFGVRSIVLEADGAVLAEFVCRHTVSIRQNQRPEGGPERNDIILSGAFAGVDELLEIIEESQLSGTDPIFDYK